MWILFLIHTATGAVTTERFKNVDACIDSGLSITEVMPETYKTLCQPVKYESDKPAKHRKHK